MLGRRLCQRNYPCLHRLRQPLPSLNHGPQLRRGEGFCCASIMLHYARIVLLGRPMVVRVGMGVRPLLDIKPLAISLFLSGL